MNCRLRRFNSSNSHGLLSNRHPVVMRPRPRLGIRVKTLDEGPARRIDVLARASGHLDPDVGRPDGDRLDRLRHQLSPVR